MSSDINKVNSTTLVWHGGLVQSDERLHLLGQRPITVWFTGLSASGKSTLAFTLEKMLIDSGRAAYVLDGDNIRHDLNKDLDFSHVARTENIRRIAEVSRLMNDAGLIVLTAFISPYLEDRKLARNIIGEDRFFEVHVTTPIQTCESRDPKGMYQKAQTGLITEFTGITAPYEHPISPELRINTSDVNPNECAQEIFLALIEKIALPIEDKQINEKSSDAS